jgi:hypothetical protein
VPCDDETANRETARQIELQQPGWLVLWGVYSRTFVAFPLFRAPRGAVLAAAYPAALVARMREAERGAHGTPAR